MSDLSYDGEPEHLLEIAGFRLTVLRRQFPEATDYWDGNWLVVICECNATGASVRAQGPFVHISELKHLAEALNALSLSETTEADVPFIEPELSMKITALGSLGLLQLNVGLTADHMAQRHNFAFDIDLSYLPHAIAQCKSILEAYPLRGLEKS